MTYEEGIPQEFRQFTQHFTRLGYLQNVLRAVRSATLYKQQWRTAHIDLNDLHAHLKLQISENTSRTFRCSLKLTCNELSRLGISALRQFRESRSHVGTRKFCTPIDGRALQAYTDTVHDKGLVLCVDIYCDGVALPSAGTQSLSPVRVRYPNIYGIHTTWFDIRLCPVLEFRSVRCTVDKKAELRRELMHRYFFLILKPVINASKVGISVASCLVFPRLLMTVCDKKQERPMVCLRSVGGTRDCTLCDMLSCVTEVEVNRHNSENAAALGTSTSTESIDALLQGEEVDLNSLKRQLSPEADAERQVVRGLGAQLMLTVSKAVKAV